MNNSCSGANFCNFSANQALIQTFYALAIGCCLLLQKFCKAIFWCKTLRNRIEQGLVKFLVPFFFFKKKMPFLTNIVRCPNFLNQALQTIQHIEFIKTQFKIDFFFGQIPDTDQCLNNWQDSMSALNGKVASSNITDELGQALEHSFVIRLTVTIRSNQIKSTVTNISCMRLPPCNC